MPGAALEEPHKSNTTPLSLVDVLHQAPRLYEVLPQCSRQTLSATCSYLHKWIRGKTSCVRIQTLDELSGITPQAWPSLLAVLLPVTGNGHVYLDSERLLQGKWHLDVQVCFVKDCFCWPRCNGGALREPRQEFVILISLLGGIQKTDFDLTPAQCEILSRCVDRDTKHTNRIRVGDRQQNVYHDLMGLYKFYQTQAACPARSLPGNFWHCFSRQDWPHHLVLDLHFQECSLACVVGLVTCRLPFGSLIWSGLKLSAAVCAVLSQKCLPGLTVLRLASNNLDLWAVTSLSQSSWCRGLIILDLSFNVFDEQALRALSLGDWEALRFCELSFCGIRTHAAVLCLAQVYFPKLFSLRLTGNHFESGALACLSGAQWPSLRTLEVGFLDLPDRDCEILGIEHLHTRNVTADDIIAGFFHVYPNQDTVVLPSICKITVELCMVTGGT